MQRQSCVCGAGPWHCRGGSRRAAVGGACAALSSRSSHSSLPPRPDTRSYEEGANISDPKVLLEVGRQLGLPDAELQAALG